MDDFAINIHTIKLEYLLGGITRESAIRKLGLLYADFFGFYTASYEEAMRSDFYIDEEGM
ncbi:MAG TPA: hypothetical protein DCW90_06035 [Lachnospiraceae bacterium]|mgnify:CR=1 FL=1|nr:hypothetical protein [Lachnospiraceae bacterium]